MATGSAFLDELQARGMVHQMSASGLPEALAGGRVTAYVGFDPTATSLHVGSLLPATMLMRLQRAGHRPIVVVGGGTGMIGDPSGKDTERRLLDEETLAANRAGMRAQLGRMLDFSGDDGAVLVDNLDWLGGVGFIEFLRDIGKHFSVNAMMARESVRLRLEARDQGISYTEFSYMLLQAYDYLALHDRYGCTLQMGGSDQWGNIVSGVDLIRRLRGAEAHALTWPLLTRADGKKFGKSEQGNVWLDPEMTTPFEFYQFWLNTADDDVVPRLRQFTFLALREIDALAEAVARAPQERAAQRVLAEEVTALVHGKEALRRAERCTEVLFQSGDLRGLSAEELRDAFGNSPSTAVPRERIQGGDLTLVEALATSGLSESRGQARKTLRTGAISVNHEKVDDEGYVLGPRDLLADRYVVLRRGKKTYHVLKVS